MLCVPVGGILFVVGSNLLGSKISHITMSVVRKLTSSFLFSVIIRSSGISFCSGCLLGEKYSVCCLNCPPRKQGHVFCGLAGEGMRLCEVVGGKGCSIMRSFATCRSNLSYTITTFTKIHVEVSGARNAIIEGQDILANACRGVYSCLVETYYADGVKISERTTDSVCNSSRCEVVCGSVSFVGCRGVVGGGRDNVGVLRVKCFGDGGGRLFDLRILRCVVTRNMGTRLCFVNCRGRIKCFSQLGGCVVSGGLLGFMSFLPRSCSGFGVFPLMSFVVRPSYRRKFSLITLRYRTTSVAYLISSTIPRVIGVNLLVQLPLASVDR